MNKAGMMAIACAALLPLFSPALAAPPADCSTAAIPDTPMRGKVNGVDFVPAKIEVSISKGFAVNEVKFDSYDFSFMVDGIFNAFTTRIITREGTRADGRTFRMLPLTTVSGQPMAGPGTPEVQAWDLQLEAANVDTNFTQEAASMRLELGQRKNGMLPGKIIFCAPDQKTNIAGTFSAAITH